MAKLQQMAMQWMSFFFFFFFFPSNLVYPGGANKTTNIDT